MTETRLGLPSSSSATACQYSIVALRAPKRPPPTRPLEPFRKPSRDLAGDHSMGRISLKLPEGRVKRGGGGGPGHVKGIYQSQRPPGELARPARALISFLRRRLPGGRERNLLFPPPLAWQSPGAQCGVDARLQRRAQSSRASDEDHKMHRQSGDMREGLAKPPAARRCHPRAR